MTDRLFKFGSFEDELMKGMEKQLSGSQIDKKVTKVSKALDYLSTAAELFDDAGRYKEAEILTKLIEKMAHDDSDHISKLIEEFVPHKSNIDNMIEEGLNQGEVEELLRQEKPKEEYEEMIKSLHEDPLKDLLSSVSKKKV